MKYFNTVIAACFSFTLLYFLFPNNLHAYLDAGSGSYIIQVLIGIAIGGAFGIKIFWRRIYNFFKKPSVREKKGVSPKE